MQNTYTACVFSNRMYENENIINSDFVNHCNETMIQYQRTVFSVYNLLYLKTFSPEEYNKITSGYKSLYLYVVNHFGFNVYYSNSIINLAKGMLDSQITLNKDYIEQKEEQIKTIQIKLNMIEKSLNDYLLLRQELSSYKEKLNKNPKTKIHIQGIKNLSFLPDKVIVRFNINKQEEYGYGKFEYQYLNNKIRRLKNLISKYHYRIHNIENKIQNLMSVNHIFFRRNIMNQIHKETDTYEIEKLKKEFINSKYYRFQISGVNIAKYGNYIFQMTYVSASDDFDIKVKFPNKEITLHHIDFPYKKEEIIETLKYNLNQKNHKKLPLCFDLIRKIDNKTGKYYYQFKLTLDILANKHINESTETGIVGIDFNFGHIDLTEIDEKGNMLNHKTILYDLTGTSKQNELSLRYALDEVGIYVKDKHKCLVIEDLNTKQSKYKFNADKQKQKKLNKVIHSLPVALYKQAVFYLSVKYEFMVYQVKPAYTSIIGKLKYADKMKLNSHISASYVIARRSLGYKEQLLKEQRQQIPQEMKEYSLFKKWQYINKLA